MVMESPALDVLLKNLGYFDFGITCRLSAIILEEIFGFALIAVK